MQHLYEVSAAVDGTPERLTCGQASRWTSTKDVKLTADGRPLSKLNSAPSIWRIVSSTRTLSVVAPMSEFASAQLAAVQDQTLAAKARFAEQVNLLYAHLWVSQAVALVNAVLLVIVQSGVVEGRRLAWWLGGLILVTLARGALGVRYARTPASDRDPDRWRAYFSVGVMISALVWGSAAWLLYPTESVVHQVFTAFALGGMVAGSMTVLTPVYWLFVMFALVTLLPIIVRLASGPDEVHSAMAVLATIFLAAMLAIGYRIHATIDESFRLRFENRDLIGTLKREKALLESRVSERTAALQALDRQKNTFLAMLSHELRNPLAPIRNSLFILARTDPGSAQARKAIEVIDRQTQHVTRLVDDLLDVTRIEQGRIELRRAPVDLAELFRRTLADHRSMFERRGVGLHAELPAGPVYASVDATRMAQVVGNLLQNAAKFTPAQGDTVVTLRIADGIAEIRVRDTGVGIEPEFLPLVFQPFTQGQQPLARTEGGIGLGLAIVKGIVELHGGTVQVESVGLNKGALFTIRLPVVSAGAAGPDAVAPAPATASRRRVLVVDDNRDAANSLASLVQLFGHKTQVAYDGPSAITMAQSFVPDVVLCDLGLPGLSGYEVARTLRAQRTDVRLVAVSGYAMPDDIAQAIGAGFDTHVAKPAQTDSLQRVLA